MKTVKVERGVCSEDVNIRNAAVNFPRHGYEAPQPRSSGRITPGTEGSYTGASETFSLQKETFDIEDVAWSNGNYSNRIATAVASGRIMLYDLHRPGAEVGRLHEHNRQVHKVDFCPIEGQYLLSASQDGTVRLWDQRTFRHVMKCESKDTFPGRNDGVRHTKWSPTSSASFALATDNGTVQRWDTRQNRAPVLKISAHSSTCTSIDWHPDGKHLISGGKDQDVKVWDLKGDGKQTPSFRLKAPRPVQNVRWRPPCYVADKPDQLLKQCTHLATSYKRFPVVHVWDLRRPFVTFREFHHGINDGTTDMLWHSMDLLWTVGENGEFNQSDLRYLPRTLDRRSLSSFSISDDGELACFVQPRANRGPPQIAGGSGKDTVFSHRRKRSKSPTSLEEGPVKGDDSIDENFLSSSLPRRSHVRSSSFKSTKSLGNTPPSQEDFGRPVTDLKQTMRRAAVAMPNQHDFLGSMGFVSLNPNFTIMARKVKTISTSVTPTSSQIIEAIDLIFTSLIRRSKRTSDYVTAQTLEIERHLINEDIQGLRKEHGDAFNVSLLTSQVSIQYISKIEKSSRSVHTIQSTDDQDVTTKPGSNDFQNLNTPASPSDAATPLARPQSHTGNHISRVGTPTLDLNAGDLDASPEQVKPSLARQETHDSVESGTFEMSLPGSVVAGTNPKSSLAYEPGRVLNPESRQISPSRLDFEQTRNKIASSPVPPLAKRRESMETFPLFASSSNSQVLLSAHGSAVSDEPRRQECHTTRSPLGENNVGDHNRIDSKPPTASSSIQSFENNNNNVIDDTFYQKPPTRVEEALKSDITEPYSLQNSSLAEPKSIGQGEARAFVPEMNYSKGEKSNSSLNLSEKRFVSSSNQAQLALDGSQSMCADARTNDFQPGSDPTDRKHSAGFSAMQSFQELLNYYAEESQAQTASNLFVAVAPLLTYFTNFYDSRNSKDQDIYDSSNMRNLTISYAEALQTLLSITPDSAHFTVISCHRPLIRSAQVSPIFIESLLTMYNDQLSSLQLFTEATLLRKLACPAFPIVYEQGLQDVDVDIRCVQCGERVNLENAAMHCEACNARQPSCPLCWEQTSPFSLTEPLQPKHRKHKMVKGVGVTSPMHNEAFVNKDPSVSSLFPNYQDHMSEPMREDFCSTRVLSACALCAHTMHAACALMWLSDPESEGICPVDGCLCPCIVR